MKRFTMIMMAMVAIATAAFAQSSIYVYRNDGNTVTIPDSTIQGMECSKVDSQMVTHTNYVMQIIKTASGDVKIPLSEIDSISFVKPVGDAVDLGLSVRWASYNVGANSSEDYGGYYAWGDSCTWTWTTQKMEVTQGMKVTGTNGNSIFLPAAGNRNGTDMYHVGSGGYYWSGTLSEMPCR
jgi:uncharacterized protein YoxC